MRLFSVLLCFPLFMALALAACSQKQAKIIGETFTRGECSARTCLVDANYRAANVMVDALEEVLVEGDGIIISDFIYLGDPSKESTLGRLIPEQISSKLAQHGFNPVSKRLANPDEAQTEVPGKARLVGSYTTAYDVLYVNARVIRLKDSAVIAGYDYELPASSNLRALIPGVWGDAGLDPTVKTAFSTAARR
ncbi:FlgO family outer membrane protein [Desulfocurvibacter africanus]|uniref:FlgO domain-containing protein n=1 Tax=Desulfocurvibacter africanus subsp. africanus str. Walvis Bay TaxID=690850 RepID=F3YX93_DESAF|nr:FlgO family outer membrane protein [Desulfocurvibacter africanus]EGJ50591.1 hypothetical protein Desaf_2265 [Desulfocurvibacter africanus subsp. africanus str. Walvis Bay]